MIRDPSDGSVRDIPISGPVRTAPQNNAERLPSSDAAGAGPDTGLRQPTRTDAQQRLEASREWLKQYRKAVYDANSMNDKGEVTNGRGSNEQSTSDVPNR